MIVRPDYVIDGDVCNMDLDRLAKDGIKGLIFDLDSTLVAPHTATLTDEVRCILEAARRDFKVAVLSNNKKDIYLDQCSSALDIQVIGRAAKPSPAGFKKVQETFKLKPEEVAVVGDRPLTDVLGGHLAGMKTVLVWHLKSIKEPKWKTFFRRMERIFIRP